MQPLANLKAGGFKIVVQCHDQVGMSAQQRLYGRGRAITTTQPDDLRRGTVQSCHFGKISVLRDQDVAVLCRIAPDALVISCIESRQPGLGRARKQIA